MKTLMTWSDDHRVTHKLYRHAGPHWEPITFVVMCSGVHVQHEEGWKAFQYDGVPTCLKCIPLGNP